MNISDFYLKSVIVENHPGHVEQFSTYPHWPMATAQALFY